MSLLLKQFFALLKLLNSETGEHCIAAGVALGFILGMSPMLSLQGVVVFLLLFVFRIQIGAAFVAAFFFKFIAWLLDPLFDSLGRAVLESTALHGVFTSLYNMPLVPLTRFNNSVVMGAGVVGFALSPVIYLASLALIVKYRKTVLVYLKSTRVWKAVQATSLYSWYYSYEKYVG